MFLRTLFNKIIIRKFFLEFSFSIKENKGRKKGRFTALKYFSALYEKNSATFIRNARSLSLVSREKGELALIYCRYWMAYRVAARRAHDGFSRNENGRGAAVFRALRSRDSVAHCNRGSCIRRDAAPPVNVCARCTCECSTHVCTYLLAAHKRARRIDPSRGLRFKRPS